MDLVAHLEKTVSPDTAELERAQKFLEQAASQDLPQFLNQLSEILANPNNGQVARIASGLQLKNALTSKDPSIRLQYQHRWLGLSQDIKDNVKQKVLMTLGTEKHRDQAVRPSASLV